MPLDAEMDDRSECAARAVLTEAEEYADEVDYEVSGELLQARDNGHAIVDEAAERDVERDRDGCRL